MNTFRLKIASPDGNLFLDEALSLSLRGIEGELAIMAGHMPFVTAVRRGPCKIELEDGTEKTGHLENGLLTVSSEEVTLLSSTFKWN